MSTVQSIAPWVEFRRISEENRQASIDSGSYVANDVDYAFITPAGSKDCVEKPVKSWFEQLKIQVENGRFPADWYESYKARYKQWVESGEIPVEGTSVKNWAVASPAQVEMLLKLHVRTVEQLAQANEEVISRLGMGGRNLVDKAKAYTTQQVGGVGKLAEENAHLKLTLEQSKSVTSELQEQVKIMQAQLQALTANNHSDVQAEPAPSAPGLSDIVDTPAPARTGRKL
jgi:hypothetical protein